MRERFQDIVFKFMHNTTSVSYEPVCAAPNPRVNELSNRKWNPNQAQRSR